MGVPRPVRLGEPNESVVRGKSVSSCDATVTCVLPVLCMFLRFWPSSNLRVSLGVPSDAVPARADAVRALEHPTANLREQYGANTGPVEPTIMGACRIWHHDYLQAQNRRKPISESCTCSSFSHGLYGPVRVQKPTNNRTNPQRVHTPSLIRVFAVLLIGKQGHKASESIQTELVAHAILILSCTDSYITVVT